MDQTPALRLEPGGRRISGMKNGLSVHVVAEGRGGWKLVEHRGRWLEVRGWVHERDLTDALGMLEGGGGGGYGMSDTRRVEVPAGHLNLGFERGLEQLHLIERRFQHGIGSPGPRYRRRGASTLTP